MRLLLIHGRKTADEEMNGWGFDGGWIEGIEAVHYTYGTPNIFFVSNEAAQAAHARTGWEFWDDNALRPKIVDGMIHLAHGCDDGREAYFGDWEYQTDADAKGGAA
jgi:hypothetical protein